MTCFIFIDPFIWKQLKKRFEVARDNVIRDVYDGIGYKQHASTFLSQDHPANLSLVCNTDGVRIFKSSKYAIWPVWLAINELPPSQRYCICCFLLPY